jgi:hypothetical protein
MSRGEWLCMILFLLVATSSYWALLWLLITR